MEIIVGKLAGFCAGVEFAVNKANEAIENGKVYCLGEIVHNSGVINSLKQKGMIFVKDIEDIPNGEKVIFRGHGEPKAVYIRASEKNLQIIDLTCANVKAIHIKIERESEKSFIIIIGKKSHPEIIGHIGFAGFNSFVVENFDDIPNCILEYEKSNLKSVYIVSQTTFSSKLFDELVEEIKINLKNVHITVDKTICNATENRQQEMKQMSKDFSTMIIIGGKNSSNTKELAQIGEKNCKNVYLIETVKELENIDFSNETKVGVMAGASTPKESIEEVVNFLKKF